MNGLFTSSDECDDSAIGYIERRCANFGVVAITNVKVAKRAIVGRDGKVSRRTDVEGTRGRGGEIGDGVKVGVE